MRNFNPAVMWLLVAALMIAFGGCGGDDPEVLDSSTTDALVELPCAIPSPTGDAVNSGTGRTAREEVEVALRDGTFAAVVTVANTPSDVCPADMSAEQCRDSARDFRGDGGVGKCLRLAESLAGGTCRPGPGKACVVRGFDLIDEQAPRPRASAACSESGKFLGWWCNN